MRLAFVLVFLAAAATAPAETTWTPLAPADAGTRGVPSHRIYNGQPTSDFPAVAGLVVFRSDGAVGLCSATLIADGVLVTAAHCFQGSPRRAVAAFFPDGVTEVDYDAAAYAIHPQFDIDVLARADVALVALTASVAGVTPMPLARARPRARTQATIVGYGRDQNGSSGAKEMGTVRLKACPRTFPLAGIERGQLAGSLCWRPKKRGQDTCQGDSGGPLVVRGAVAGVTSGGYPACPGKLSWDTSIAAYRRWIDDALQQ